VVNGYVDVVKKYIECPICKTKIRLWTIYNYTNYTSLYH
jgi:hypothetical protein